MIGFGYGTEDSGVIDASMFPLAPVGSTQATMYACVEHAATLMKVSEKQDKGLFGEEVRFAAARTQDDGRTCDSDQCISKYSS